jgi:uncharacterized membrane protein
MSATAVIHHEPLPLNSAFRFLAEGFQEMKATQFKGLVYGVLFVLMGYAIHTVYQNLWQVTMGLTAGFFLMGPFLCCGIYDLSRQRDRGYTPNLSASTMSWSRNWKSIAFFAAILTFFMIVWARVSVVLFALFGTHNYPDLRDMITKIISFENIEFLMIWAGVGFVFASLVFAISVVSMPLLLDRGTDTMEAIGTSAKALWNNSGAMFVWAVSIVVLIGASLVIFLPLLAFTAPLVGHATWRLYKHLVPAARPA